MAPDRAEGAAGAESPGSRRLAPLWVAVFLAASALYLTTAQRTGSWQDSGEYQYRVLIGAYRHHTGLARAHPGYIVAARALAAVPIGGFAWRAGAFSGLAMAAALANLAALTALLTGRRWVGAAAAGMLMVTHATWSLSTVAEVYTLSVAGLTAELWLLAALIRRPRWPLLVALAMVSGLGVTVHNFALLPLPVYAVAAVALAVRRRLPAWALAAAAAAWLAGASPYIALTAERAAATGDWAEAAASALVGGYRGQVLNRSLEGMPLLKVNAALAAMSFVSFLLPLAVWGWIRLRRRLGGATAAAVGAITLIELAFVLRYPVPDQFTFMLPSLVMIALAAGLGLADLADRGRRWRAAAVAAAVVSIIVPPAFYAAAPAVARAAGVSPAGRRKLPYRDELRYWLVPWKHNERSADRFARAALEQAAPDGVIVALADPTCEHPPRLLQRIEGLAPGVTVVHSMDLGGAELPFESVRQFRRWTADRPTYVVRPYPGYCPPELLEAAGFHRPEGAVLYRLTWPN
jgi:hypothetical protein